MVSIMKHFTKKDWLWTFVVFLLTIVEVASGLMTVECMQKIVELVMNSAELGSIFGAGGIMVAFALFSARPVIPASGCTASSASL